MIDFGPDIDQEAIDDFAGHLFNLTRSVGMEQGSDLLLYLLYLRAPTDSREEFSWQYIRNNVANGVVVPERLLIDSLNGRLRQSQVDEREVADNGTGVIKAIVNSIAHWPFATDDDGAVRQVAWGLFEAVLRVRTERLSRTAGTETPESISNLMARVVVRPGASVLDPACGAGSTLIAASAAGAESVEGWDLSAKALTRASMRFELAQIGAEFDQVDAMKESDLRAPVDNVLTHPPFGQKPPEFDLPADLETYGVSPKSRADLVWIQLALSMLTAGGRAAALLPAGALFRSGAEANIRRFLVDAGAIEAIISLPGGAVPDGTTKSAIWILRSPLNTDASPPILFLNGERVMDTTGKRPALKTQGINRLVDLINDWREDPTRVGDPTPLCASVELRDLGPETVLSPERYLLYEEDELPERPQPPGHLISSIKIGNVKSFGETHEVELAPITLLYGPNSSGKSSLLQSLLLMKQSIGARTLVTQGDLTDAGSFEGLVHRHDTERDLSIGLTYSTLESWEIDGVVPTPSVERSVEMSFRSDGSGTPIGQTIRYLLGDIWLKFDKANLDSSRTSRSYYSIETSRLSRLFEAIADRDFSFPFPKDDKQGDPQADRERRKLSRRRNANQALRHLERAEIEEVEVEADGILPGASFEDFEFKRFFAGQGGERDEGLVRSYLDRSLRVVAGVNSELRRLLADMTYLGPLRSAPQRYYNRAAAAAGTGSAGENIALHLFDNSSEADEVNAWLARLGIPYEVNVLPVRALGGTAVIGDSVAMVLTDTRSGVEVSPSDVGFGVSQVLPIVVQLLAKQETVICIEQPEIHLHPKVQTELAELLIQSASSSSRNNQIIVETHSEHLLLRLQRRIREGAINANDVAVVYVEQDEAGAAKAQRLRMDDKGFFIDPWPAGFFDDSLDELFGGLD